MQFVKGFVIINKLVSNTPGVISPIGELSSWSRTYSKEKGEYTYPVNPGYKIVTFKSVDNDNQKVVTDTALTTEAIIVVDYLVKYAEATISPYSLKQLRDKILVDYNSVVSTVELGPLFSNGVIKIPEWISWTSLKNDNSKIKLWLVDEAFQNQYDDYQIEVIPPLTPIDTLLGSFGTVKDKISKITFTTIADKIEVTKSIHPETYIRTFSFKLTSALDNSQSIDTPWTVLIYGKAGDNIDSIKDAIVEYITKNTARPLSEWMNVLGDIFKRTEFIILPRWDLISIVNLTSLASLYGSVVEPNEAIAYAKSKISFYDTTWTEKNINVVPYDYKAITTLIVAGPKNLAGKEKFLDIFPDYIPVNTGSLDFGRMQEYTRTWMVEFERLIIEAERVTPFSSIPNQFRRIYRDNKLYVTWLYDNVNYLIYARVNDFAITNDEAGVITA